MQLFLGWPKCFRLFQKLIELYAKTKSMWNCPFRYMHFQCDCWRKSGWKSEEKNEKRSFKMRSMNTYVCDTKPASNKSQKTKKKKKNNSHCSYRDKRQEEKGPGQDLCLKCCLSCRPMNETAIGSVQGRWPAPTAGAKNFRNDGRKAEKCGEKRF